MGCVQMIVFVSLSYWLLHGPTLQAEVVLGPIWANNVGQFHVILCPTRQYFDNGRVGLNLAVECMTVAVKQAVLY